MSLLVSKILWQCATDPPPKVCVVALDSCSHLYIFHNVRTTCSTSSTTRRRPKQGPCNQCFNMDFYRNCSVVRSLTTLWKISLDEQYRLGRLLDCNIYGPCFNTNDDDEVIVVDKGTLTNVTDTVSHVFQHSICIRTHGWGATSILPRLG